MQSTFGNRTIFIMSDLAYLMWQHANYVSPAYSYTAVVPTCAIDVLRIAILNALGRVGSPSDIMDRSCCNCCYILHHHSFSDPVEHHSMIASRSILIWSARTFWSSTMKLNSQTCKMSEILLLLEGIKAKDHNEWDWRLFRKVFAYFFFTGEK